MTDALPIVRTADALRAKIRQWRVAGNRIALVPTMGALHDGHLSLVRHGRSLADRVVVSIFVNPTQFGPSEDFTAYPRQESRDATLLTLAGASLLYAPTVADMYPSGFATAIQVGGPSEGLCGTIRPGHFSGVATVVCKLLTRAMPDVALFGEKDYQQLQVIKRLARDLDLPVEIVGGATVREADGLAMSSRNAYLSAAERAMAPSLYRVLSAMAGRLTAGDTIEALEAWGKQEILAAGFPSIDYLETRDTDGLRPLQGVLKVPARILVAARLGKTRLIDNIAAAPA